MVLDGKSSQEYEFNAGVLQGSILGPTFFLLYIDDLPEDVICDIAIYADDTTLYSKCDLICGNNLNWLLNLNLGLLVFHLLPPLNAWLIVELWPA